MDDDLEIRECENCSACGPNWVEFELTGMWHDDHRFVTLCESCGSDLISQVGLDPEEGSVAHFAVDSEGNVRTINPDNVPKNELN